jgi:cytochrome c biogenesis factor
VAFVVSRKHVPAALVVAGVVLLLLSAVPVGGSASEYAHRVEPADDTAQYEGEVIDYANLSERGQTVFDRARGQVSRYVVENESMTAPEFDYPSDTAVVGDGIYPIRYEDRLYVLTTQQTADGDVVTLQVGQMAAKLLGAVLLALGGVVEVGRRIER